MDTTIHNMASPQHGQTVKFRREGDWYAFNGYQAAYLARWIDEDRLRIWVQDLTAKGSDTCVVRSTQEAEALIAAEESGTRTKGGLHGWSRANHVQDIADLHYLEHDKVAVAIIMLRQQPRDDQLPSVVRRIMTNDFDA